MCSPQQHLYLHKQTPTLTFTATPGGDAHSLVGEDPLDKMGGTLLSEGAKGTEISIEKKEEFSRMVTHEANAEWVERGEFG